MLTRPDTSFAKVACAPTQAPGCGPAHDLDAVSDQQADAAGQEEQENGCPDGSLLNAAEEP